MKKIIITVLMSFCLLTSIQAEKLNALHYAVSIENKEYIKELVNQEPLLITGLNELGQTPIHLAISENKISLLKLFIEELKVNPNILNKKKESLLLYAIKKENISAIDYLLKNGGNPYLKDQDNRDSFFYARLLKNDFVYNLLIEKDKKEIVKSELEDVNNVIKVLKQDIENEKKNLNDIYIEKSKELNNKYEELNKKIEEELNKKIEKSTFESEKIYGDLLEELIEKNRAIEKELITKTEEITSIKRENLNLNNKISELENKINNIDLKILEKLINENKEEIQSIKEKEALKNIYNRKEVYSNDNPIDSENFEEVNSDNKDYFEMIELDNYSVVEEINLKKEEDKKIIKDIINNEDFIEEENLTSDNIILFESENENITEVEIKKEALNNEEEIKPLKEEQNNEKIILKNESNETIEIKKDEIIQKPIENINEEPIFLKDKYSLSKLKNSEFFTIENILIFTVFICLVIIVSLYMVVINLKKDKR